MTGGQCMEDKAKVGLKEQRERRKRINRMKMGIIMSIFVWMLISMVVCVTLLVKVHSLENRLELLTDSSVQTNQINTPENKSANSQAYNLLENGTESLNTTESAINPSANIMSSSNKDNLAQPGDPLKVYLTFDDGPSSNTATILDTLAKYNVKATFFVIGKEDDTSKELYKRIVAEGHTLGMHSYSHKYSEIYNSLDGFQEDFSRIQNLLYDVTGEECTYYRFPGGSSNQVSNTDMKEFISYLNAQGITYFDWNVSSGDATSQAYTADELVENVVGDVVKYKTSVVLMHDSETKPATVEALGPMIEALNGLGAQILPIDGDTTAIQHVTADSVK